MSNTVAEAVPAPQPQVESPAATPAPAQPNKRYSNVQKTVGAKAKAFLDIFHTAGEHIRGNINAALDGAGDAIAGRKPGTVVGRKSGEETARSVPPPTAAVSDAAPVDAATEPAPAATADPTSAATGEEAAEKRFVVGQFINTSFKRTATLVHRVGGSLRSKSTSTVGSLGDSISAGKQRASRRFSRAPKPTQEEAGGGESSPMTTPVPTEAPLAAAPSPVPEPAVTAA
ncbi:uncharacterized protein VP01_760g11 [Puccinia sorghi]|uniref:Uncharacterized protein n=1 Tax=Puccinia sorghi TaxID=27349 RepID=A0A0L6UBY2_9BASI|nr:uncharacterized protein VP01_760g11 [Puccinia sorghi]